MNDDCQACTFWQRIGAYVLLRLREPSTWSGIIGVATALTGWNISPEKQAAVITIGTTISFLLLIPAREGRVKADNPSIGATISGEMPPAKPAIVPPASTSDQKTVAIDPQHVPVAADGELQAPHK